MVHRGVRSEVNSMRAGAKLFFISYELQVNNARSMIKKRIEYGKENPLIISDKSCCARSENVYGSCYIGLFKVGKLLNLVTKRYFHYTLLD